MATAVVLPFVTLLAVLGLGLAVCLAVSWRRQRSNRLRLAERQAHDRAEALLGEILTDAELAQLGERGYLEIASPSQPERSYRVPRSPGRVCIVEKGVEVASLCVGPTEWIPAGDIILTHKLMIEGNEQEYLRRANHYLLRVPLRTPAAGF